MASAEEFIELGFTWIRRAFEPHLARECRAVLSGEIGADEARPETWPDDYTSIERCFTAGPFAQIWRPEVRRAMDHLLGRDRYEPLDFFGWWAIKPPVLNWDGKLEGWHVDGLFQHRLDCREQGCVALCVFSDVPASTGGTALAVRSHHAAIEHLRRVGSTGASREELALAIGDPSDYEIVYTSGEAGDIMIMHPWLLHTGAPNLSDELRFVANPRVDLHEPKRGNADEPTALEQSCFR